jgi:hypothetical protein
VQKWLLPEVQKVRLCPTEVGELNRSEVSANVIFLAKLNKKEFYLKMVLRLGLIKSNCLFHRGCTNTFKVSADNDYKGLRESEENDV